ncbi:MAG: hypothetical protein ACJ74O_17570 [Frankiaceae bacterium]
MGSGVILLVIVAMWAVVLVPTMLRRHDSISESRSVDRFSAAMRILSRRTAEAPGRREVVMPARPESARRPVVSPAVQEPPSRWKVTKVVTDRLPRSEPSPARATAAPARPARPARPVVSSGRRSLAVRRRRMLLGLLGATVVLLIAAPVLGGPWWGAATCAAVLLLGYCAHLRAETRRTAQLTRRRSAARAPRSMPADRRGWASGPQYWGEEQGEVMVSVAMAAGVGEQLDNDRWDPVDVPLPTYVTKPPAPQRRIERPRPGEWSDGLLDDAGESVEVIDATGRDELDDIIERRRAVGD